MIHSVFELGDTIVREVMVPRNDVVYIERHKNLRQTMSLFLRSGFSRVPVVGEDLDDIVGFLYLKDVSRRVFDRQAAQTTEQVESMMRPVSLLVLAFAMVGCGAEDEEPEELEETESELVVPSKTPPAKPVKKGDTMSGMAQRYNTTVNDLVRAPCKTCR